MLIRPVSDLHSEFWNYEKTESILNDIIPKLSTDKETVLVIAGDLGLASHSKWGEILDLLKSRFLNIIHIAGNHFFYNTNYFDTLNDLKYVYTCDDKIFFLENEYVDIITATETVTFIGANLWTSFNNRNAIVMLDSQIKINDYHKIKNSDYSLLTPDQTVDKFYESEQYIFSQLKNHKISDKVVVVTHHGISPLSVHNHHRYDKLRDAYITDLTDEIEDYGPNLWIHGHLHDSSDYKIGRTRVIVNPYGYRNHQENLNYINNLVVEV